MIAVETEKSMASQIREGGLRLGVIHGDATKVFISRDNFNILMIQQSARNCDPYCGYNTSGVFEKPRFFVHHIEVIVKDDGNSFMEFE